MEQRILKVILIQLKIMAIGCFAVMALVLTTAFRPEKELNDFWKQLGITKEEGDDKITEGFLRGYLLSYGTSSIKNIVEGDKVAMTKSLLSYCKHHVNSEEFRREYMEYRKKVKPVAPSIITKDQVRKELLISFEEAITNQQSTVNMAITMKNEEMKKSAEKSLAQSRKTLEEVNSGNCKQITEQLIYADMRYKSELEKFQVHICDWENNYPADSRQLIKKRLTRFLDVTKDIDFNATVKEVNGKKIFTNPSYERKSAEWKMGYRAGKDVVQTARTFATQWIKELQ